MKPLGKPSNPIEEAAEEALRNIADLNTHNILYEPSIGSVVSPIHRGVESACFHVKAGPQDMFLKIRYPDMAGMFNEVAVAAGIQHASELNVGPRLIHADADKGNYLLDRLGDDWEWGKVDRFEDLDVLEKTIHAKKMLHDNAAPMDEMSVFDVIERYVALVQSDSILIPKTLHPVLQKVRESAAAIRAAGVSLKPCHGDGVASNIMISDGGDVQLVDFDSAGNQDPYSDLGSFIVEIAQFPDLARSVLEIYDGECRESEFNRCMLYGIADDLKWALWGFISFAKSPRRAVEFVKYAEWRLLRSVCNADGPDFDRWLHKL